MKSKMILFLFVILSLMLSGGAVSAASGIAPTLTDLGPGTANAINDAGQVVGTVSSSPFLWTRSGGIKSLAPMLGTANAINNRGQVAGGAGGKACVWSSGGGTRCWNVDAFFSWATDINEAGVVAGTWSMPYGETAFFGDKNGHYGAVAGLESWGNGINNSGQVVGQAVEGGVSRAFIWTKGGGKKLLPGLGGHFDLATAINNAGQVVGQSHTASEAGHAFLWTPRGGSKDLGTLGGAESYATAIDDLGQVVGYSTTSSGTTHAFLWTAKNGMQDLGTLGGSTSHAKGINSRGQIVGDSTNASGATRAVLWQLR